MKDFIRKQYQCRIFFGKGCGICCSMNCSEANYYSSLIDTLCSRHSLTEAEYEYLLDHVSGDTADYAAEQAVAVRRRIYGNEIYIRGLIEISNYCRNDCFYCGIRRSNRQCKRYRLQKEQILACCDEGYLLGFRTFVLQGGEDAFFTDEVLCDIVRSVKRRYPDCAITLSLGEKSRESYAALFQAGADRYLLRHETADSLHYGKLHPKELSLQRRLQCLHDLREIGYQVGCGFMVGSPYQTNQTIAKDLKLIETFSPDMCGIGPFIPHHATPFAGFPAGTLAMTTFLLSLVRLISPSILLPATTALGTIHPFGREKGILAGANVVMPNLSPPDVRAQYELYDNKLCTGEESAQSKKELEERMAAIGYTVVTARGDIKRNQII